MAFTMITQNPSMVADVFLAITATVDHPDFEGWMYAAALLGFLGLAVSKAFGMKNDSSTPSTFLVCLFIFWIAVQGRQDVVLVNTATAESYVVSDVPIGIGMLGWLTSAFSSAILDLMGVQFSAAGGGDVLAKNGVGKGLAVLQGLQSVPWSDRTRNPFGAGDGFTNLESSINSYLGECYIPDLAKYEGSYDGVGTFHKGGASGSMTAIWRRVETTIQRDLAIKVKNDTDTPRYVICHDAWIEIAAALETNEFKEALLDDAIMHMARSVAATTMPGNSSNLGADTPTAIVNQFKVEATALFTTLFGSGIKQYEILLLDRLNTALLGAYHSTPNAANLSANGRLNSAWSDAKRQADLSMAAQGDWWTRNAAPLSATLEILVYSFIPIMLIYMFVSAKGMKALTGIAGVYLWMQTWPIAHLIINYATVLKTYSTIELFVRTDAGSELGMQHLYAMWDQVRHSYAVSQSLLGMTPLLTGALLSGSMMMLTRFAGNLSSNENFDEKRVARDTENASPVFRSESSTSQFYDAHGNVVQAGLNTGTGTSINVSDSLSRNVQEAESNVKTSSSNLSNALQRAITENKSTMSTEALEKILGLNEAAAEQWKNGVGAGESSIATARQAYAASVGATIGVDGRLQGKTKGGGASAGVSGGVTGSSTMTHEEAFMQSKEYREALEKHITTTKDLTKGKSAKDVAAATNGTALTNSAGFTSALSQVEAAEARYSEALALQESHGSSRTIDEGRQWEIMQRVGNEALGVATVDRKSYDSEDEYNAAREQQMAAFYQSKGIDVDSARNLAELTNDKNEWGRLATREGKVNGFTLGSALLNAMRHQGGNAWQNFIIQNDADTFGNQKKVHETPTNKTGVNRDELLSDVGIAAKEAEEQTAIAKGAVDAIDPSEVGSLSEEDAAQHKEIEDKAEQGIKAGQRRQAKTNVAIAQKQDAVAAKKDNKEGFLDRVATRYSGVVANYTDWNRQTGNPVVRNGHTGWGGRELLTNSMIGASQALAKSEADGLSEQETRLSVLSNFADLLNSRDREVYDTLKGAEREEEAINLIESRLGQELLDMENIRKVGGVLDANGGDISKAQPTILDLLTGRGNDKTEAGVALARSGKDYLQSDYYKKHASELGAARIYEHAIKDLASVRDGQEARVSDVEMARAKALMAFMRADGQRENINDFVKEVANKAHGDHGIGAAVTQFFSSQSASGNSITQDEIAKIFEKHFGSDYHAALAQMPRELTDRINGDANAALKDALAKVNGDLNMLDIDRNVNGQTDLDKMIGDLSLSGDQQARVREYLEQGGDSSAIIEMVANQAQPSPSDIDELLDRYMSRRDSISN